MCKTLARGEQNTSFAHLYSKDIRTRPAFPTMDLNPPNPLISVIIPVANGAEFLWESLTSVLQQTYTNWECWVALNGEGLKGPAVAVAEALADERIHVIPQSPTIRSKVAALNNALSHCRGEWIALLDVDDRWAPTKLAEQVAAAQGPAADALVIGTAARYFGEFSGTPSIPFGFVDTPTLCEANPIINSSALIRKCALVACKINSWRKLIHGVLFQKAATTWSYHPSVPTALEDYFLWMKVALLASASGRIFYNVPRILVDHRIHAASAFNSRADSPAPLQAWYRMQLAAVAAPPEPIRILTTVCGAPHFIRAQVAAFRQCLGVPWEFVVFNDAKDWPDATNLGDATMRRQVEETCRELGVRCISVANQGHRGQPSASQRHCETLRVVMDFVRKEPARYWMIDSDMWPVAFMGPADIAQFFQGSGTFVRQSRSSPQGEITYAWPNLWWMDTTRVDISNLCWDLVPYCDTGGASVTWVSRHTVQWLPPHLSSGRWGLKDLPEHLKAHPALLEFLMQDPRNNMDYQWAELYTNVLFHVRAGSNWNGEGLAVHQQIADLTKSFFS
jgi:glycosyltransferase involved in cell wall biosynthesis